MRLSRSFLSLMYNNFQMTQTDTYISTHYADYPVSMPSRT